MRGRAGSVAATVALLATFLAACTTSNIDHPRTIGLAYPRAIEVIEQWCPTATIRVVPDTLPGSLDPNLLYVGAEFYRATTPPPDVPKLRAARSLPSLPPISTSPPSTTDSAGGSSPDDVQACDASVPTTVTLRLETPVPPVTDLTVADARALLETRGLLLDVSGEVVPDDAIVLSQEPAPDARIELDAVPATMPVSVTVGILVPDLASLVEDGVCETLVEAGLACELVVTGDGPAPGLVINQDPKPGDVVPPGTTVMVTVVREVAPVVVPSVLEEDLGVACAVLDSFSLECRFDGQADPDLEPYVVDQEPEPGALVPVGTAIALTIATRNVRVPGVLGMSAEAACATIEAAGLVCRAVERTGAGEPGHVAAQEPGADEIARRQAVVTVRVPTGVMVPDVRNLTRDAACQALVDAGLRCGSGDADGGTIVRQDPPANSLVAEDTEVVLTAFAEPSSGLPPWTVVLAVAIVAAIATVIRRLTRPKAQPPVVRVELGPVAARVRADEVVER